MKAGVPSSGVPLETGKSTRGNTGGILHVVYVSSAVHLFRQEELDRLIEVSQRNNERLGISGFLAYVGGNFIQSLEGPKGIVLQTLARIRADPRHHRISIILEDETVEREGGERTLAYYCHGSGQRLPEEFELLIAGDETLKDRLPKHCIKCVLLKNFLAANR